MTKHKKIKKPWPTKDAMTQIYENNLWGGNKSEFYSGLGSHHPETVNPYIAVVSDFLADFKTTPVVYDLGCGDLNSGKELVMFCKKNIAVDMNPVGGKCSSLISNLRNTRCDLLGLVTFRSMKPVSDTLNPSQINMDYFLFF